MAKRYPRSPGRGIGPRGYGGCPRPGRRYSPRSPSHHHWRGRASLVVLALLFSPILGGLTRRGSLPAEDKDLQPKAELRYSFVGDQNDPLKARQAAEAQKYDAAPQVFTASLLLDFGAAYRSVVASILRGQRGGDYEMRPGQGMALSPIRNVPPEVARRAEAVYREVVAGKPVPDVPDKIMVP